MSSGSGLVLAGVLAQFQELLSVEAGHKLQLVGGHVGVGTPVLVHPLDRERALQLVVQSTLAPYLLVLPGWCP
jgi:hypothetical protein